MIKVDLPEQTIQKLQRQLGTTCDFLGFTIDLEKGVITDNLSNIVWTELTVRLIPAMLSHYAGGNPVPLVGKPVKFRDIPGGYAYEGAFINRAIRPIEENFGKKPQKLIEAAIRLGGKPLKLGDASVEIQTLKGIPLIYILYSAEDYPASASILYDESASCFLPTEDLAVLGELASMRLIVAEKI